MNTATLSFSEELIRPYLFATPEGQRLELYIKGVHCGHCVYKIEKSLKPNTDILHYRFESGGHRLTLWGAPQIHFSQILQAIRDLGFEVIPLTETEDGNQRDLETKQNLKRLAVAAVAAGNIMLFSVAIYLGADGEFRSFFHRLSLALVLPVLLYSAQSIWRGSYQSLKTLRFNLDLPIGLALGFGFFMSLYSLLAGLDHIYFDTLAVVVFIILSSRMMLKYYVDGIYLKNLVHFVPGVYQARVWREGGWSEISHTQLSVGDRLLVRRGEIVAADGELLSKEAVIDQAVLTGETKPRVMAQGDPVFAGTQVAAGEVEILVRQVGATTRVGQYVQTALHHVREGQEESFVWVSRFTAFVILAAVVTFAFFAFQGLWEAAFQRSFAMIIIACPCAMSFGIPLIRLFSGQLAMKNGIVIRKPTVLKKLHDFKSICFDKTGTLTQAKVKVNRDDFFHLAPGDQKALLALELSMDHPISNGFKEFLSAVGNELPVVENFRYRPGLGIEGDIGGDQWAVRSYEGKFNEKKLQIYKNGEALSLLRVSADAKEDLDELFRDLVQRQFKISILSGDDANAVNALADQIPLESRGVMLSQATPEQKESTVSRMGDSCIMVGDGINDIIALQKAPISVCMPGALENNMSLADITLTRGYLKDVQTLFKIGDRVLGTERRLFAFTCFYNLMCVGLAGLGWISPVAAAVIMPVSSFTVLTLVTLGLRRV